MLNVLRQASVAVWPAIGMTFVIATGGIDLSVGSMVAAAASRAASSRTRAASRSSSARSPWASCSAASTPRDRLRGASPFIATLAMFTMARGLALWLSDKTPVSLFSLDGVRWFGNGEVIGIPSAAIVFLAVTAFAWVLLNRTRYGRYVVATAATARRPGSPA